MTTKKLISKSLRFASASRKWAIRDGQACPSCGSNSGQVVDRKKFITTLRRCQSCQLLFRSPTVSAEENSAHYNDGGDLDFAAMPPGKERLDELLRTKFHGSQGDLGSYMAVLKALGCAERSRVLDFGCSWGYLSWQLGQAGYQVQGFEINRETCSFARDHLAIDAHSSLDELEAPFDVFFSNHVLEHLPDLRATIDRCWELIRPGGLFIAFTPNGCEAARRADFKSWHSMWGFGHPNFLDDQYYSSVFGSYPRLLASTTRSPYAKDLEQIREWGDRKVDQLTLDLSGEELLIAVRKP